MTARGRCLFKHNGRHVIATTGRKTLEAAVVFCARQHENGHDAAFQKNSHGDYIIWIFAEPHEDGPPFAEVTA